MNVLKKIGVVLLSIALISSISVFVFSFDVCIFCFLLSTDFLLYARCFTALPSGNLLLSVKALLS